MATSPNYAWAEPDNSSLVKNGASDIRTLGDAIDTSVWNVGFGQAGKNKIINGDFGVNQRSFTSTTTNQTYTFDRWQTRNSDGTVTYTAQTFTPGTAPVAGYEGTNYAQIDVTGQTLTDARALYFNRIEDVRTFAGQTVTLSFWAKATSGTPSINVFLSQGFGTGGSSSVDITATKQTISTSWARYSWTINVPSISGKTIGTGSQLLVSICVSGGSAISAVNGLGIQTGTFQIWGVQLEAGSKATPFQTATGTIQGELAACQRYFEVVKNDTVSGVFYSTTAAYCIAKFNVQKRGAGTLTMTYPSTLTNGLYEIATSFRTPTALATDALGIDQIGFTATGMSSGTIGKSLRGTFGVEITASAEL